MYNFVLLFILAISPLCQALVEFPSKCLAQVGPICHFGTVKKSSSYIAPTMSVFLAKDTLLKRDKGGIEWIYGSVLFEVTSRTDVQFKKNTIELQKGKYLFFGEEGKLSVEVLDGLFKIARFEVTEGFEATFSMDEESLSMGPLQPIDLKEHLVRYSKTKNLDKDALVAYLELFQPKHKNYVLWASELNQSLIQRSIANEERAQREMKEAKHRARLAQQRQKQAYFDKVFGR